MNATAKQVQDGRAVRGLSLLFKDGATPLSQDSIDGIRADFSACIQRRGFRGGLRVDWSGVESVLLELANLLGRPAYCVILLGGRPSGVRLLGVSDDLVISQLHEFQPFDDDAPARDAADDRYLAFVRDLQITLDHSGAASEVGT